MQGRVVWAASIDPFGRAQLSEGFRFHQPLRWPGHYYDSETGLQDNRFRTYAPGLGRYLQPDPLGLGGGLNLYAAPASPVSSVDLRGLKADCGPTADSPESEGHPDAQQADPPGSESIQSRLDRAKAGESIVVPDYAQDRPGDYYFHNGSYHRRDGAPPAPLNRATSTPRPSRASSSAAQAAINDQAGRRRRALDRARAAEASGDQAAANAHRAEARQASERMGEIAADDHVRQEFPDARRVYPAEGVDLADRGRAGPGTADLVYRRPDGSVIVVEAKGGDGTNSSTRSIGSEDYQQGHPDYLSDTAEAMARYRGTRDPDRRAGGRAIEAGIGHENSSYIMVQQPGGPLDSNGNPPPVRVSEFGEAGPRVSTEERQQGRR